MWPGFKVAGLVLREEKGLYTDGVGSVSAMLGFGQCRKQDHRDYRTMRRMRATRTRHVRKFGRASEP